MRSITHVLAAELPYRVKSEKWMRRFVSNVTRRPDDAVEILARAISIHGRRPIPKALRKGLADAFDKWDAYQLAKYDRGEAVKPSVT